MSTKEKISMTEFQEKIAAAMKEIGEEAFVYDAEETAPHQDLYDFIDNYAKEHQLYYTSIALPLVRGLMSRPTELISMNIEGITRYRGHYPHCLSVCKLLVSLVLPLENEEEDIALAAALCHVLPNKIEFKNLRKELEETYLMDPRIGEIIALITDDQDLTAMGQKLFFDHIQANKLALVVLLSDRANLIRQLYTMDIWTANQYIYETRTYFFPMCIYAKEHYPDIMPTVNVLMEKVRTMVDACAILLQRYETKEMELTQDIITLKEENSRLRVIIRQLKGED